jgi:hypothetical protein
LLDELLVEVLLDELDSLSLELEKLDELLLLSLLEELDRLLLLDELEWLDELLLLELT